MSDPFTIPIPRGIDLNIKSVYFSMGTVVMHSRCVYMGRPLYLIKIEYRKGPFGALKELFKGTRRPLLWGLGKGSMGLPSKGGGTRTSAFLLVLESFNKRLSLHMQTRFYPFRWVVQITVGMPLVIL